MLLAAAASLCAPAGAQIFPAPTPSPTPPPGTVTVAADAHLTFISQNTNGSGRLGLPEAPAFIAGTSPAAPLTPYDTFSGAPMTPGNAAESALYLTPTYYGSWLNVSATLGVGYVTGSTTNATYWGESLLPTLNPHLGSQLLGYGVAFPVQPGQDDGSAFAASLLSGSIATKDGGTRGLATLELTAAALPSLPGSSARLTQGSLVIDHGEGTRYSVEVSHVTTGGAPVPTTILFASGTPVVTSQGLLPFGTIGGQRETIYGLRAAFHVAQLADGALEYGHSVYDADGVAMPGSGKPGNYYHAGLTKTVRRATASIDVYKNEPYYATAILPYGAPENVWSVAWSWPGQWLKSNYQLINNYPVNVDRQGYRIKYQLSGGPSTGSRMRSGATPTSGIRWISCPTSRRNTRSTRRER